MYSNVNKKNIRRCEVEAMDEFAKDVEDEVKPGGIIAIFCTCMLIN